jgi:hypothetical protein
MKDEKHLGEDQLLISWLRNEREDLVQLAKNESEENQPNKFIQPILAAAKVLLFVVYADPKVFDGQSILSGESERHAQLTSGVVSGATLLNAITNWPILFYAFNYAGAASAWVLSSLLNVIILWWTNQAGTTAASRKHGNKMWSGAGVLAFLAMSTIQSVVSGVGAELINNQEGLSYMKAEELVTDHVDQLEETYENWLGKQQAAKRTCTSEEKSLNSDSANFNREFVRVYGGTFDQVNSGNVPNANAPCAPTQIEKFDQEVEDALTILEETKLRQIDMNNDIELLKAIEGEGGAKTYKRYFDEKIENGRETYVLRSGTDAITLASESFWNSLTFQKNEDAEKAGVNMSLFFFALSVITSLSATIMIVMHSQKLDTKMSRSSKVEDAVSYWLESVRRQYARRCDQSGESEESKVGGKLLSLYIEEYRESGKCDYPMVQAIAKMSQEGMDLRLIQDGKSLVSDIEAAYSDIDKASTALIKYLSPFISSQDSERNAIFSGIVNYTKLIMFGQPIKPPVTDQKPEINSEDLVKENLANLYKGVTRLILLSNRYAAAVSLEGDKEYYKAIKALEKQLKETLSYIRVSPIGSLNQPEIKAASMNRQLSDLPSSLVRLQIDCAELKEITQEEIRNKLIPLFVECTSNSIQAE